MFIMSGANPGLLILRKMTKAQYDNIMSCIRRRGTKSQRRDGRSLMESIGYAITHANVIELRSKVSHYKSVAEGNELLWLQERNRRIKAEFLHLNSTG